MCMHLPDNCAYRRRGASREPWFSDRRAIQFLGRQMSCSVLAHVSWYRCWRRNQTAHRKPSILPVTALRWAVVVTIHVPSHVRSFQRKAIPKSAELVIVERKVVPGDALCLLGCSTQRMNDAQSAQVIKLPGKTVKKRSQSLGCYGMHGVPC